jgi:flagellar hook-basal body complex protein FliE
MTAANVSIAAQIAAARANRATDARPSTPGAGASFRDILAESIEKVNHLQKEADEAITGLVTGERNDIARTMVAVEKASLSFQLMTRVREQMVQAYEEILRMTV